MCENYFIRCNNKPTLKALETFWGGKDSPHDYTKTHALRVCEDCMIDLLSRNGISKTWTFVDAGPL